MSVDFEKEAKETLIAYGYDESDLSDHRRLIKQISASLHRTHDEAIESAARICESAPQRLSPMDMSVRLRNTIRKLD